MLAPLADWLQMLTCVLTLSVVLAPLADWLQMLTCVVTLSVLLVPLTDWLPMLTCVVTLRLVLARLAVWLQMLTCVVTLCLVMTSVPVCAADHSGCRASCEQWSVTCASDCVDVGRGPLCRYGCVISRTTCEARCLAMKYCERLRKLTE